MTGTEKPRKRDDPKAVHYPLGEPDWRMACGIRNRPGLYGAQHRRDVTCEECLAVLAEAEKK